MAVKVPPTKITNEYGQPLICDYCGKELTYTGYKCNVGYSVQIRSNRQFGSTLIETCSKKCMRYKLNALFETGMKE